MKKSKLNKGYLLKSTSLLLLYLLAVLFMKSQGQSYNIPQTYISHKVQDNFIIDGLALESDWGKAKFSSDFIDIEGVKTPNYKTNFKMLWDDIYLYIYAEIEEPHVWGNLKQRDTVIFYNNDFEVFIDPDGDTHNYYELEVNSLNTQWDLFLTKPYRNGAKVLDSWDIQNLRTAVNIKGSLNNPSDIDVGWSIEMAIPWQVITEAANHNRPPADEFWRINFSRVNWDFDLTNGKYSRKKDATGKYLPEYNWVWSPQEVINMHEPERWGYVFFSSEKPSNEVNFEIPKNEHIKWNLYRIYREVLAGSDKEVLKELIVFEKKIQVHHQPKLKGRFLWCESPFTNTRLIIEQDGKFLEHK